VVFEEFVDAPLPNVIGKRGCSHHWPDKVHADKVRSIQYLAINRQSETLTSSSEITSMCDDP